MIDQYPSPNGVLTSLIWRKTASGGETSLSGYDNASQALSYTPGQEQVYLNGILLVRGDDYTATNGTSITGLTALAASDYVQIVCYNNFSVASVPSTSITGTITSGQVDSSIVTTTGTQTLTNKTLTSPTITNASGVINNTLTTTTGDLIYASSANTPARLGIGSTGQYLTVSGGVPAWGAVSANGMTLISTTSANNSASIIISSIPATYKNLQIVIRNMRTSVDNPQVYMRLNGNTGSVYREMVGNDGGQAFNQTYFQLDPGGGADSGTSQGLAVIDIPDYANSTTWKLVSSMFTNNNGDISTTLQYKKSHGFISNITDAINSVTFLLNSGNIVSGDFLLYGIK